MELHELEKVLKFIEALQDRCSPTLSAGSALMLISELKITPADKMPEMLQQLDLYDVAGRRLSYKDNFKVVAEAIEVIVAYENGNKLDEALS